MHQLNDLNSNKKSSKKVNETLVLPSLLRHQVLQKFQASQENKVPTLEQALRRASTFGTIEDIDTLLFYGAKINSQEDNINYTALHLAVIHMRPKIAEHLLKRHASRHITDADKKIPSFYVKDNAELIKLFSVTTPQSLRRTDALGNMLTYLNNDDLHSAKNVSYDWALTNNVVIRNHFLAAGLIDKYPIFKSLPGTLKYIICRHLIDLRQVDKLKTLFDVLALSHKDRFLHLFPHSANSHYIQNNAALLSDFGIALSLLGYLPSELYDYQNELCKDYGAIFLASGILTSDILKKYSSKLHPAHFERALRAISCKYGYSVLSQKLISPHDLFERANSIGNSCTEVFGNIFSEAGLLLLRKKIISGKQILILSTDALKKLFLARSLYVLEEKLINFGKYEEDDCLKYQELAYKLDLILTSSGIKALKEGWITQERLEMKKLTRANLECLLSEEGMEFLRDQQIPWDVLVKIPDLKVLISKNGLMALRNGYILPNEIELVEDLKSLLSDQGIHALKMGMISVKDAIERKSLSFLRIPNALTALKERLITLDQVEKFYHYGDVFEARSLTVLMSDIGLQALREKLITPEQASKFYHSGSISGPHDNLDELLSPTGIEALRERLITPADAYNPPELRKIFPNDKVNQNVIKALRYKLFSMTEINYCAKYSLWGNDPARNIKDIDAHLGKLVSEYEATHILPKYQNEAKEIFAAARVIQKHWRIKKARQKLSLFHGFKNSLKNATIKDQENLRPAAQLIKSEKAIECKEPPSVTQIINQSEIRVSQNTAEKETNLNEEIKQFLIEILQHQKGMNKIKYKTLFDLYEKHKEAYGEADLKAIMEILVKHDYSFFKYEESTESFKIAMSCLLRLKSNNMLEHEFKKILDNIGISRIYYELENGIPVHKKDRDTLYNHVKNWVIRASINNNDQICEHTQDYKIPQLQ